MPSFLYPNFLVQQALKAKSAWSLAWAIHWVPRKMNFPPALLARLDLQTNSTVNRIRFQCLMSFRQCPSFPIKFSPVLTVPNDAAPFPYAHTWTYLACVYLIRVKQSVDSGTVREESASDTACLSLTLTTEHKLSSRDHTWFHRQFSTSISLLIFHSFLPSFPPFQGLSPTLENLIFELLLGPKASEVNGKTRFDFSGFHIRIQHKLSNTYASS